MITIKLDKDVKKEIEKQIRILDKSQRILLFKEMQLSIVGLVQEGMDREESPDGTPWKKSLRAVLTGGKTLRNTSRLFQSIGINNQVKDDFFTIGSNLSYAEDHEEGNPKGQKARDYEKIYANFTAAEKRSVYERISKNFSGKARFTPQRSFLLNPDGSIPEQYTREINDILQDFFNR